MKRHSTTRTPTCARSISRPAIESAQAALQALQDIKSESLLRRWDYRVGRAAHMAIGQVERLIDVLNEHDHEKEKLVRTNTRGE
jgi:hypothetical protein